MARLDPELEVAFSCLGLDLGKLTRSIMAKILRLASFELGFENGLVLHVEGLSIRLSMYRELDEQACRLQIACSVEDRNRIDLCLAVASTALHELFTFLHRGGSSGGVDG